MNEKKAEELAARRRTAARIADVFEVVAGAERGWWRLADCRASLIALTAAQREQVVAQLDERLSRAAACIADYAPAGGNEAEAASPDLLATTAPWLPPGAPDHGAAAELLRDARLIASHPTAMPLRPLRNQLKLEAKSFRRAAEKRPSRRRLASRLPIAQKLERAPLVVGDLAAPLDAAEKTPQLGGALQLAAVAPVVRKFAIGQRQWVMAQAWFFAAALMVFAGGDFFFGNTINTLMLLAVLAVGPAIVIFERYRSANRGIWIPRWAIVRSCVLQLILCSYILARVFYSAIGFFYYALVLGAIALAVVPLILVDSAGLFSQASLSAVVGSVVAVSSLVTFLYTDQYKPRVAQPLLTTTVTLEPEPVPSGLTADPNRVVLKADVTLKNDGETPVQVMASLYRVDGLSVAGSTRTAQATIADVRSAFELFQGNGRRFSAPTGARLQGIADGNVLVQADELIPANYRLAPKESWSTSVTVVVDVDAVSSVRLSTEVLAARSTHLELGEPKECESNDDDHRSYECWRREITDRSLLDRITFAADSVYVYLVTGDQVLSGRLAVPTLYVGGHDLSKPYYVPVDDELARRFSLGEFSSSAEWSK
jgi:hypothetical protein